MDELVKARGDFAPCPLCKQYSHSIGEDRLAKAFLHFQSMHSHRGDGIPTQHNFDEATRDAAQVLMEAARWYQHLSTVTPEMVDAGVCALVVREDASYHTQAEVVWTAMLAKAMEGKDAD